jgi:competence ComEA-like helix-hairpin-helix protein
MIENSKKTIAAVLVAVALAVVPDIAAAAEGRVNINSANADQLSLLPRVGAVVSQRIIDFREQNGEFKSPEDLMLVEGIGEKTFELMEEYVTVSGETTLKEKVRISRSQKDEGAGE